jgi:uncharacterized membrane protein YphA (DoxX/SURF4 family)
MFNPFPELLVFGFWGFPQTLLRLAAAGVFIYIAYHQYQHREAMAKIPFPIVGTRLGMNAVWAALAFEAAFAAALVVGYYTQVVALLGMVAAAKYFYFGRDWPTFAPISRGTSALLFVILLTLLISGAGAFAYDLPL